MALSIASVAATENTAHEIHPIAGVRKYRKISYGKRVYTLFVEFNAMSQPYVPPHKLPPEERPRRRNLQQPPSENEPPTAEVPPTKVIVVEDKDKRERPLGVFAVVLFLSSFLGALIPTLADFGGAVETIGQLLDNITPPVQLCVAGSNTILGEGITMAQDWEATFEERNRVDVTVDGIGSVRGVERAAEGGCVNVLAMSEPMTQAQYDSLVAAGVEIECAAEIGYDVIAFVTDANNPVPALLQRNLSSVLLGTTTNWSEIGGEDRPIYILARPGSGTTEVVLINVARYTDPNINDDQYFPPNTNYVACESNEACLDLTLSTNGSLYWVSSAWMRTQPPEYLRVMPILRGDERPINPLTEDVDLNAYPSALIRPLYFYVLNGATTNPEALEMAKDFLSYVRSVDGQQVLEQYAFYNHFSQPAEVDVALPPGFAAPPVDGPRQICV
jgi:phosphate transport system substrate-binding protein